MTLYPIIRRVRRPLLPVEAVETSLQTAEPAAEPDQETTVAPAPDASAQTAAAPEPAPAVSVTEPPRKTNRAKKPKEQPE